MMNDWHLLPVISAPMPFQMALDEILFRHSDETATPEALTLWLNQLMSRPVLRFYFSSEPWVSVGYSAKMTETPSKHGVPICRRITGGGRVEHGRDLIFSVIAKKDHDVSFASVRTSYLKIHEAVKAGFGSHNRELTFYRCDQNLPKGGDCFKFPIATDLGLNGQKVAGGAQKRSMRRLLHQESIQPVHGIDHSVLQESLIRGFENIFNARIKPYDLIPEFLERVESFFSQKSSSIGAENNAFADASPLLSCPS